jgi:hypothetical protein
VVAKWTGIVALCIASLVVCCLLAAWQWRRFQSASGTLQNFGYVLQWPLFGIFPAFMVWRIGRLAKRPAGQRSTPEGAGDAGAAGAGPRERRRPTEPRARRVTRQAAPAGRSRLAYVAPGAAEASARDGGDEVLAAYNRYLAGLHAGEDEHVS